MEAFALVSNTSLRSFTSTIDNLTKEQHKSYFIYVRRYKYKILIYKGNEILRNFCIYFKKYHEGFDSSILICHIFSLKHMKSSSIGSLINPIAEQGQPHQVGFGSASPLKALVQRRRHEPLGYRVSLECTNKDRD